jgi:hypothetical protein
MHLQKIIRKILKEEFNNLNQLNRRTHLIDMSEGDEDNF